MKVSQSYEDVYREDGRQYELCHKGKVWYVTAASPQAALAELASEMGVTCERVTATKGLDILKGSGEKNGKASKAEAEAANAETATAAG